MSTRTLEIPNKTHEYLMVRDHTCVMRVDVRTSAWLASHNELSGPASLIGTALVDRFKSFGGEVCVSVQEDPETGEEKVLFTVLTRMNGREARQSMREFVRESLPDAALPFRDDMIFSVSPMGKSTD